ncbi:MAG: Holliday junction resolvase RuvX [Candidatus Zixiibacteriota bacterium]
MRKQHTVVSSIVMSEGRILAIDYGRKRVGVAISDPTRTIATGLPTLVVTGMANAVNQIAALRDEWQYVSIVVGLPLRTSGEAGDMAAEVREFAEALRAKTGVPVNLQDERFTSGEAGRIFHQKGKKLKGRKGEIDQLAAELILRQHLDSLPI